MSISLPCPDSDLLHAILRGSASAHDQEAIARHLEECTDCRRTVDMVSGFDDSQDVTELSNAADSIQPLPAHPARDIDRINEDDVSTESNRRKSTRVDDFVGQICEPSEFDGSIGRVGNYELLNRIGRGGMGVVYRAHDPRLGRDVALKLLHPRLTADGSFAERFIREAQAAAGINHHNVITVHAIEEAAGVPIILMEYVEGESLQNRLRRLGPLPLQSVVRIGVQIADGLEAAHQKRLVHRDIKPSNILLAGNSDEVRVTDFGLVQAEGSSRLTQSGILVGTPRYMAPEQARGDETDYRSDLFSLGSVLYEMCVGHAPFTDRTTGEILRAVALAEVNPISVIDPTLPRQLVSIINRLHALRPEDRIESASQVAKLLRQPLNGPGRDSIEDDGWTDVTVSTPDSDSWSLDRHAADTVIEPAPSRMTEQKPAFDTGRQSVRRIWPMVAAITIVVTLSVVAFESFQKNADDDAIGVKASQSERDPDLAAAVMDPAGLLPNLPFYVPANDEWFESMQAAVDATPPGDLLKIASDKPISIAGIRLVRAITICAETGYQPILRYDASLLPANAEPAMFILDNAPVEFQGLTLEMVSENAVERQQPFRKSRQCIVECARAPFSLTHCRIYMFPPHPNQVAVGGAKSRRIQILNSEIFAGTMIESACPLGLDIHVGNSIAVASTGFKLQHSGERDVSVSTLESTFITRHFTTYSLPRRFVLSKILNVAQQDDNRRLRFHVAGTVIDSRDPMIAFRQEILTDFGGNRDRGVVPNEIPVDRLLKWTGFDNLYDLKQGAFTVYAFNTERRPLNDVMTDWMKLLARDDETSRAGTVTFHNGTNQFDMRLFDIRTALDLKIDRFAPGLLMSHRGPPGADPNLVGPGRPFTHWIASNGRESRPGNRFAPNRPRVLQNRMQRTNRPAAEDLLEQLLKALPEETTPDQPDNDAVENSDATPISKDGADQ